MQNWVIESNIITQVSDDGTTSIPSANEIFISLSEDHSDLRNTLLVTFPELRFSKISSQVHGHFWFENEKIHFELQTKRRGKSVPISFPNGFADYYVYDNTWFYLSNITPQLQECLSKRDRTADLLNAMELLS